MRWLAPVPAMSAPVRRRLFLHSWTDKALLVSPDASNHSAERLGGWLPKSQITEIGRTSLRNPRFGEAPGIAVYLGTIITFDAPGWLLESRKLDRDAEGLEDNGCPDCGGRYLDSWYWCPPCTEERVKGGNRYLDAKAGRL